MIFSTVARNTLLYTLFSWCALLCKANTAQAMTQQQLDEIQQRIKPVGIVCIAGQSCQTNTEKTLPVSQTNASTANVSTAKKVTIYTGRKPDVIYNRYCVACHASGAAGAPRVGNAKEWHPHAVKGMNKLLSDAIKGIGAMPPKGLCFDCSNDELKHTIEFMLKQSQ